MYRYVLALFLIVSLGRTGWSAQQNEVDDALAHAEALYYQAMFKESIELLVRIDDSLRPQREKLQEKTRVKLQLALNHLGLNDPAQAKSRLRELYALDTGYSIDRQQLSPKVVALAEEAKAEQSEALCRTTGDEARKQLKFGNVTALMDLIGSMKSKCDGLAAISPEAADLLYRKGVEAYKRNAVVEALQNFQAAVKLNPQHELASQYMEIAQTKQRLGADLMLLEWRRNFEAREFAQASVHYRQLVSFNTTDTSATPALDQARAEYRKSLSGLVESWNRACAANDMTAQETVRTQITAMVPEPSFGDDILSEMTTCAKTSNSSGGCAQMSAALAMVRIKTRVNPEIPSSIFDAARRSPITVRVRARINERGDVTVGEVEGGSPRLNDSIRNAVSRWKFHPAIINDETRCVETEIPMVISPNAGATTLR